jgi:hypothetical protein
MRRSSGAGELDVVEKAERLLAGDKVAAAGNHLREGSDQILGEDGPETVEVLGLVIYGYRLTSV